MLRIARTTNDRNTRLTLEGKLVGPWVEECRSAWNEAQAAGGEVSLDLSDVTFVDQGGLRLLRQLVAAGVRVPACSNFVAELLREEHS